MNYNNLLSFLASLGKDLKALSDTLLLPRYGNTGFVAKTSTYDLLSDLDEEVERKLHKLLGGFDKSLRVVGEELGGDRTASRYWLVDPIDGTIHFVRGNPFCTIMIALIEDGEPVAGAIFNIFTADYVYAVKGKGAFRNGSPIKIAPRPHRQAVICTELGPGTSGQLMRLRGEFKTMDFICAGYEFAQVADGSVDARVVISPYGKDYDFAPGILITEEAGAVVKALDGSKYSLGKGGDFIVASNNVLYECIRQVITDNKGE